MITSNKPFEFNTVPSIQMEWSSARRLGERLASRFAARKALVVTDAGLVKAGVVGSVVESLDRAGFDVAVFDAIVADPPESILLRCANARRSGSAASDQEGPRHRDQLLRRLQAGEQQARAGAPYL